MGDISPAAHHKEVFKSLGHDVLALWAIVPPHTLLLLGHEVSAFAPTQASTMMRCVVRDQQLPRSQIGSQVTLY